MMVVGQEGSLGNLRPVVRITTVYDNGTWVPDLVAQWGFACLVGDDLLFDTGGDGRTLLFNMAGMGIDPTAIRTVVLSHVHADHTGGLGELLASGVRPTVYVPRSFPRRFKADVQALATLVEVHGPAEIRPGVHTTGEMGSHIVEQAVAVETGDGLVVVTGCAHPGVAEMVRRAKGNLAGPVALVIGGFHLGSARRSQLEGIIRDFRRLGVQRVAPCHCTGEQAIATFASEYGDAFIRNGVGRVITIGPGAGKQESHRRDTGSWGGRSHPATGPRAFSCCRPSAGSSWATLACRQAGSS